MRGLFGRVRGFDGLLMALGLAALFCMVGAPLAMIAAISIIGLPIAAIMALVPPVFFFLLTVRLAMLLLPSRGGWIAAVGVAAAIFVAIPFVVNRGLDREARSLAAGDLDAIETPVRARSLAVVEQGVRFGRDQTQCDDFCLRALLSRSFDRVMVAEQKDQTAPLDPATSAVSFRMERRTSCPPVNLSPGVRKLDLVEERRGTRAVDASELMRLEIAAGHCLIEEPARLGDAEALVRIGEVKRGKSPYAAGLDLFADTVRADRVSYWQRSAGGFEERYRLTAVVTHRLLPVLVPSYITGYGFEIKTGFQRTTARLNVDDRYEQWPNRARFFGDKLKLALSLDSDGVDALRTAALNQRLDQPGTLDALTGQVAEDFFQNVLQRRALTVAQAEQGQRIVADARIRVPRGIHMLATLADTLPDDVNRKTADVLMTRLSGFGPPVDDMRRSDWSDQVSTLGNAIRHMPAETLRGHRAALESLARREELRVPAWQALVRLSDFGADAVPTLLYLIEDAERFRGKNYPNEWQHPYLAGLIGLCRLGGEGSAAVAPLLAHIDAGRAPLHASYGDLMINTLIGSGVDAETIWPRFATGKKADERDRFDRTVARARKKRDCSY